MSLGIEAKLLIQVSHGYGLFWQKSTVSQVCRVRWFFAGWGQKDMIRLDRQQRGSHKKNNNTLTQGLRFIPNNRPL